MPDDVIKIAIEAVDNASATFEKVGDEVEKLGERGKEAGAGAAQGAQGFESFAGKLVAVQAGVSIAQEAIGGLKQVWDFAKQGAENQRIAESFQRTAKSIGVNADDIVAKLDEAARGTVDDEELMQASTRALTLGVAKSGDDLINVMKLARGAALQFGGDAGTAFESINQAIGNLAPRALKQYGIIVSLKEANEAYAKTLGVTADSLTEEQQRQALLNAVLEQGKKNFGDIGNAATTTGEKMKALETRVANLVDVIKEVAATGFGTAFDITDAPKTALEAFIGTAQKMKAEVVNGKMSVKDYNDALRGMANNLTAVLPGAFADAAYNDYKLNESLEASTKGAYGLNGALDESSRATRRAADEAENLQRKQQQLSQIQATAAAGAGQFSDAYDESARALRRTKEAADALAQSKIDAQFMIGATNLAIGYTESQQKQADVQKELDDLNAKIAARGPARVATISAEAKATGALVTEDAALIAARNAAADVAKRDNESSAQYAMRLKDAQTNLKKLTSEMGSHIVTATALSATDQKSALNQARLAAAQEDLATAQKKKGETDAEFLLRVETIKSKIADYSKILQTHTGTVGGATQEELKHKKALEEQIAALQKAGETEKAKAGFDVLNKALSDGIINETQYTERTTALNAVTHLYTDSALKEAQAQELFLKSLADPNTESYRNQLLKNQDALDGIVTKTGDAAKAIDGTTEAIKRAGIPIPEPKPIVVPVKVDPNAAKGGIEAVMGIVLPEKAKIAEPVKINLDTAPAITAAENMAQAIANTVNRPLVLASPTALIQPFLNAFKDFKPSLTATVDTKQATKDFDAFYTGKVGTIPAEKKTTMVADTTTATKNTVSLLGLYGTTPPKKTTLFEVKASEALQTYGNLYIAQERLHDRIIDIIVRYSEEGEKPATPSPSPTRGYQYGGSYVVPPNPSGSNRDYFPVLAAPGERVTIETKAQQNSTPATVQSGDTYIYNTNVYNPLAAAMLADKQRRDRLARSNARMGVV